MKIKIKKYLIQEGVLDSVKNNWGKLALGGVGVAAAYSGALGDSAQKAVQSGGKSLGEFMDKTKQGFKTMNEFYKDKLDGKSENALQAGEAKTQQIMNDKSLSSTDKLKEIDDIKQNQVSLENVVQKTGTPADIKDLQQSISTTSSDNTSTIPSGASTGSVLSNVADNAGTGHNILAAAKQGLSDTAFAVGNKMSGSGSSSMTAGQALNKIGSDMKNTYNSNTSTSSIAGIKDSFDAGKVSEHMQHVFGY